MRAFTILVVLFLAVSCSDDKSGDMNQSQPGTKPLVGLYPHSVEALKKAKRCDFPFKELSEAEYEQFATVIPKTWAGIDLGPRVAPGTEEVKWSEGLYLNFADSKFGPAKVYYKQGIGAGRFVPIRMADPIYKKVRITPPRDSSHVVQFVGDGDEDCVVYYVSVQRNGAHSQLFVGPAYTNFETFSVALRQRMSLDTFRPVKIED